MANEFPASLRLRGDILKDLQSTATVIKQLAADFVTRSATMNIKASEVASLSGRLADARDLFMTAPGSQSFIDYAQAAFEADGYTGNIVTSHQTVLALLNDAIGSIVAVGDVLYDDHGILPTGRENMPEFTPEQTAGVRAKMAALRDAIT